MHYWMYWGPLSGLNVWHSRAVILAASVRKAWPTKPPREVSDRGDEKLPRSLRGRHHDFSKFHIPILRVYVSELKVINFWGLFFGGSNISPKNNSGGGRDHCCKWKKRTKDSSSHEALSVFFHANSRCTAIFVVINILVVLSFSPTPVTCESCETFLLFFWGPQDLTEGQAMRCSMYSGSIPA